MSPAPSAMGINGRDMRLRFLSPDAEINPGDLLQTSGHGGVLPAGIPVGRIKSGARGQSRVVVSPAADLQRLAFVTILVTDEDPGYEVDSLRSPRIKPLADTGDENDNDNDNDGEEQN